MKGKTIDLRQTGANLKKHRLRRGYSVKDICVYLGDISPQSVYKWEHGSSIPSIDNLILLSELYDVSINEIVAVR